MRRFLYDTETQAKRETSYSDFIVYNLVGRLALRPNAHLIAHSFGVHTRHECR